MSLTASLLFLRITLIIKTSNSYHSQSFLLKDDKDHSGQSVSIDEDLMEREETNNPKLTIQNIKLAEYVCPGPDIWIRETVQAST